jgi:hypothetical protein
LTATTSLPWLSGLLLTDIFAGLAVLALYLIVLRGKELRSIERMSLVAFIGFAVSTHSATFAVLCAMTAVAAVLWLLDRTRLPAAGLCRATIALALGAAFVLAANFLVARQLAWTPGGFSLAFGRMLQDGIVKRYLDDHCPDPTLRLCAYRAQLPRDADEWFWGNELFDRLGRFAGLSDEMRRIAIASVIEYPVLQAQTAAAAAAKQLVSVATGEGVVDSVGHTYAIIERFTPHVVPSMRAARQQHGEIDFTGVNRIAVPVALLSILLLPVIALRTRRRAGSHDLGELTATIGAAILINAAVCGILANPHDRYGARLAWIATFAVLLVPLRRMAGPKAGAHGPSSLAADRSPAAPQ